MSAVAAVALLGILIPVMFRAGMPSPPTGGTPSPSDGAGGTPPVAPMTSLVTVDVAAPSDVGANVAPAAGAAVVLRNAATNEIVARTTADPDGKARFIDVKPGDYVVAAATQDGEAEASTRIAVTEAKKEAAVGLALERVPTDRPNIEGVIRPNRSGRLKTDRATDLAR